MSRITPPAEKILAVAAIYNALKDEFEDSLLEGFIEHPGIVIALIDTATRIAMSTDTRDMGLLGPDKVAKTDVDPLAVHVDVEGTP